MLKVVIFLAIAFGLVAYYSDYFIKEDVFTVLSDILPVQNVFSRSLGEEKQNIRVFKDIQRFNGKASKKLYLAILGDVYDVSNSSKHYGPGSSYYAFIGRDVSRSFVTGKFTDSDISDNLKGFKNEDYLAIKYWVDFYNKSYKSVGRLIGSYYNEDGSETPYKKEVIKLIQAAEKQKEQENDNKKNFPSCNSDWDPQSGTKLWCTQDSGGVQREWSGVPRKYYEPGSKASRCACVNQDKLHLKNLEEYEGCASDSIICHLKED